MAGQGRENPPSRAGVPRSPPGGETAPRAGTRGFFPREKSVCLGQPYRGHDKGDFMENTSSHWIAVGDIHDETSLLDAIPELATARGLIVTGDLTNVGGVASARRVMNILRGSHPRVLAQTGNMDRPEVDRWLTDEGCNLHARCVPLDEETVAIGIGGSTVTPFHTPTEYTEEQYADWLATCWREAQNWPHRVIVSHNPPRGTACDRIRSGAHVGSTALRDFLEAHTVDVCLCGHIHEASGEDWVAGTHVLNPGAFGDGGYVVLDLGATPRARLAATTTPRRTRG